MKITSDQQPGCAFFVFLFPFPVSSYLQRMDGWDIHKFQIKLPEEVNLTRRRVSSNCLSKALFSPVSRTRFSRNSSRSGLSWPTCQNGSLKKKLSQSLPRKTQIIRLQIALHTQLAASCWHGWVVERSWIKTSWNPKQRKEEKKTEHWSNDQRRRSWRSIDLTVALRSWAWRPTSVTQ